MKDNKDKLILIISLLMLVILGANFFSGISKTLTLNPEAETIAKVSTTVVNPNLQRQNTKKEQEINNDKLEELSYIDFLEKKENKEISTVYYKEDSSYFYIKDAEKGILKINNPDYETFKKELLETGIEVKPIEELVETKELTYKRDKKETTDNIASFIFLLAVGGLIVYVIIRDDKETSSKLMNNLGIKDDNIPNQKAKQLSSKTFNDIAGLYEVKRDLNSVVDFLKNKEKYKNAGAKLPKGIILYGPPGTGKTLLSKALAGESGVNFLKASGSDFVEMYVGVGPKRIRELFKNAKAKAPCIIFIDEIDAIGKKRGTGIENSEDRKTINALLTEMDGFDEAENILVIGATNRIEDLDPALLRPGRFTNKFCVPLPCTPEERLEIINLYSKDKKFNEDVDFKLIAKETIGFSPAQIESLLNEAAIISVQKNQKFINKEIIDEAMFKMVLQGHAKENQSSRDKEELKLVAWHEAGHALIGKLNGKEISKVTIISSTSGAGGVTFSTPQKMGLFSVEDLKNEVKELYGGRIAEFLLYGDKNKVTTGASNDIDRATNIIKEIVTKYGMSDKFGLLNLEDLGLDKEKVLEEEIVLAKELENDTIKILKENKETLEKIAKELLEKETIYESDLDRIIKGVK